MQKVAENWKLAPGLAMDAITWQDCARAIACVACLGVRSERRPSEHHAARGEIWWQKGTEIKTMPGLRRVSLLAALRAVASGIGGAMGWRQGWQQRSQQGWQQELQQGVATGAAAGVAIGVAAGVVRRR